MNPSPPEAAPVDRGAVRSDLHAIGAQIADAARRTPPRARATRVIAIDGPSGSGKSSLAQSLAAVLDAPIIHLDEMYEGWSGLSRIGIHLREWVIDALLAGRDPRWQPWDWELGVRSERWQHTARSDFLIIEGCGAGDAEIAEATSFLVWVDAPAAELDARLRERQDWAWYEPNRQHWRAQETATHARNNARVRADAIVDNGPAPAVEFA